MCCSNSRVVPTSVRKVWRSRLLIPIIRQEHASAFSRSAAVCTSTRGSRRGRGFFDFRNDARFLVWLRLQRLQKATRRREGRTALPQLRQRQRLPGEGDFLTFPVENAG